MIKKSIFFVIASFLLLGLILYQANARDVASTDSGTLGADKWSITSDGDLVPNANTYSLGTTSYYPEEICLGGECKSSWGSVISPMTDASGYVYPTDAGSKLKLHDDGDLTLGGAVATDVAIFWDSDTDDFYMGTYDTDNDLQIGLGATLDTNKRITIPNTFGESRIVIGDAVNGENKGFVFAGDNNDFYVALVDNGTSDATNDTLVVGVGSSMGAIPCFGASSNTTTPKMYVWHGIDAPGAVDIDYGSADITDHLFTTDGGTVTLDGVITFDNGEFLNGREGGQIAASSDSGAMVFEIHATGTSDEDATLKLSADAATDSGDTWEIVSDGATNDMLFRNNATGTQATQFTIADGGVVTSINYIDNKITDTNNTSTVDVAYFTHDTSNTAGASIGVGTLYRLEDGSGNIDTAGSIDVIYTTETHGSEDADVLISHRADGVADVEGLRLVAASSTTAANKLRYTAETAETDGVVDILELKLNSSGTPTTSFGAGISIQLDDASLAVEEQASLDVVLTAATTNAEDADIIFSQNATGVVRETLRLVGTSSATTCPYLQYSSITGETNGIVDVVKIKLDTLDVPAANLGMGLSFQIDDGSNAVEEQASIDVQLSAVTDAGENADIIFNQNSTGVMRESLKLVGATSATTGNYLKYSSITGETDGIIDIMQLRLDTLDVATTNLGVGISIQIDDAGAAVEEQASIDFQLSVATDAAENCDIIVNQNTTGVMRETLKLVATSSATTVPYIQFTGITGETNATLDTLVLKIDTLAVPVEGFGTGISIQIDDRGGVEEQASIDFLLTATEDTAEDCDVVFSQNVAGTMLNTATLDASLKGGLLHRRGIEISTTDDTLASEDSGKTFVLLPGMAEWDTVTYTLPAAAQGLTFTFVAGSADTLNVDVTTGDQIMYLLLDANDKITSPGSTGDSVTLTAIDDTRWIVESMFGQNVSTGAVAEWTDGG